MHDTPNTHVPDGERSRFWLFSLTGQERVTWAACFGGRVLDAMDSQVYALMLPTLIGVFALSRGQAGMLGSLTTVVAAFSTLIAGAAADRFGRLRVLQAAIAISAVSTALAAFAHSFTYLAVMRAIQGIGYAAELTASSTLVNEMIQSRYRARAVSGTQSGYAVGYGVAVCSMLAVHALVPADYAWRVLFGLGIVPALYVILLQRFVGESKLFLAAKKATPAERDRTTLLDLFRGRNARNTLVTAMISVGVYGAAQVMIFWLPTYLQSAFHLDLTHTGGYLALNIVGSFLGPWIYGPISDRFGRRPVFLLFLSMQAVAVPVYLSVGGSLALTLGVGFVVGLLQGGLATGVQPMLGELFGTRIRGRAIGLNNAFVRATAAIAPALVGYLAGRASFGMSMISVAVSLYVFAALGVLLAPETRGVELTADAVGAGDARHSAQPELSRATSKTSSVEI
ncbi:MFS transporter [Paraburkholderia tropica]|uniref:MFS transporter n=1 Tax=Paraburkholderia tropica TaxID=92647 RepID=UPI002AB21CD4|nr:MFS transporter [Paraburkholderia tropica]